MNAFIQSSKPLGTVINPPFFLFDINQPLATPNLLVKDSHRSHSPTSFAQRIFGMGG